MVGETKWEYWSDYLFPEEERAEGSAFSAAPAPALPKFSPQHVQRQLNELGSAGWELVHMEPVRAGSNHDVLVAAGERMWTNAFFCVLKRPKSGSY